VIESERGFSVVQVLEVRPGAPAPFEQVRHDAAQRLIIEKQKALRDAFIARLRAASKVTVLEGAVARAVTIQDEAAARHIGARQASGGGNRP
jgi:parvulin-like peptidyl-prolyl isomerase